MLEKKSNIVFIGLMGTGKTSIGKRIARVLGYQFIDTDEYVEKITEKKISDIFKKEGELRFRSEETLALRRLSEIKGYVISTGGGIVLREENRKMIKELGFVVHLDASDEKIYKRVSGNKKRPLLQGPGLMEKIIKLREERNPLYSEIADCSINTGELGFDRVIKELVKKIKNP